MNSCSQLPKALNNKRVILVNNIDYKIHRCKITIEMNEVTDLD